MMIAIEQLKIIRSAGLRLVSEMDNEHIWLVPEGFNNNLAWNLGHLVVTQQLLHYKLAGLPMLVDDTLVENFKKGTGPSQWGDLPDMRQVRTLFRELPERLAEDYAGGKLERFEPYKTSAGITLNTVDEAILFNNFHEGLHIGYMMAMARLVH